MSILRVDEIRDNGSTFNDVVKFANSGGTQNGTLCRAWVNFNGISTIAIRANFNVNSITDNGTGDYTVNFSNALADANYVASGLVMETGSTGNTDWYMGITRSTNVTDTFATGSLKIAGVSGGGSPVDPGALCVSVFR